MGIWSDAPPTPPSAARLIVRIITDERAAVVRLHEPPRPGEIIQLPDGTRVRIKRLKAPRRGDRVDALAYATVV